MNWLDRLETWFESCPKALVAFSGGVDSALVTVVGHRFLGERMQAVIADSASLKRSELAGARAFSVEQGIPLAEVQTFELENPLYAANPGNRCYHCKTALYTTLRARDVEAWILNGTNTDDLGDHRPGLSAADEHRVRSPLAEVGMDKAAVRALARELGLGVWDKPASPCLSSRIPYGQVVTAEKLAMIEAGEAVLVEFGFPVSRVRHHGERAVVEVPHERVGEMLAREAELTARLTAIGFAGVVIDPEGFVSGKLNRAIGKGPERSSVRRSLSLNLDVGGQQ